MPGLVNQRRLAVAAGLQVEVVGLVLVDEGMALDVAIAAVRAVQERRVSGRLRRAGVGIHVDDVGAGAVDLAEARRDQIVPQLQRVARSIALLCVERLEPGHCAAQAGVRVVELPARRVLGKAVGDHVAAGDRPDRAVAVELRDDLVERVDRLAVIGDAVVVGVRVAKLEQGRRAGADRCRDRAVVLVFVGEDACAVAGWQCNPLY